MDRLQEQEVIKYLEGLGYVPGAVISVNGIRAMVGYGIIYYELMNSFVVGCTTVENLHWQGGQQYMTSVPVYNLSTNQYAPIVSNVFNNSKTTGNATSNTGR